MAFFHRGGPNASGKSPIYITGKVVQSGAATNVLGGTLTATTDSAASCVITWTPAMDAAGPVQIFITALSADASYNAVATGIGTTTAGILLKTSAGTASGFGFGVLIIGQAAL